MKEAADILEVEEALVKEAIPVLEERGAIVRDMIQGGDCRVLGIPL